MTAASPTATTLPPAPQSPVSQDAAEQALAVRYAPVLRFDEREPFLPLVAGYTVFRTDADSPSFPRRIELAPPGEPPAALAIEYAIWWDWDIQHLYELEHVWVYVDRDGRVARGEASWHGDYHDMRLDNRLPTQEGRLALFSEPGKHAFAPTPEWFHARRKERRRQSTDHLAGSGGVWVTPLFRDRLRPYRTPQNNTLVRTYLSRHAFQPAWTFSRLHRFESESVAPWPQVEAWIPQRVAGWIGKLAAEIPATDYRFLRIGHRGASAHAPDNTLAAMDKAMELDADAVEIDLQVTADGQTVVVHDPFLRDARGEVLPVGQSTLARLQAIDVGGGERVPTFDQVVSRCREHHLSLYIEIKDARAVAPVVAACRENDLAREVVVASFRADWLAEVKAQVVDVSTSILFSSCHVDPVPLARSIAADYVHPCWEHYPNPSRLLTQEWIERVRAAGLGIICWHEERPQEIAALRRLGVDGICSDAPELLL